MRGRESTSIAGTGIFTESVSKSWMVEKQADKALWSLVCCFTLTLGKTMLSLRMEGFKRRKTPVLKAQDRKELEL